MRMDTKQYCKRYARPAEANWRLGGFGRPVWWHVGRLWGGFVVSWGAFGELWGGSGAALGRLWGAYGRLVGPKWPQVDARMAANGVKRPQEAATRPLRAGFWSPKMAPRGSKEPSREA